MSAGDSGGVFMSNEIIKNAERSRTVIWDDPKISARDAQAISGLDYLRCIKRGEISLPPNCQTGWLQNS